MEFEKLQTDSTCEITRLAVRQDCRECKIEGGHYSMSDQWIALSEKMHERENRVKHYYRGELKLDDLKSDILVYCYCDGRFHWKYYGYRQDRKFFAHSVTAYCPHFQHAVIGEEIRQVKRVDREQSFDTFDVIPDNQGAFDAAKKFMSSGLKILYLRGHNGRGKTHLSFAIFTQAKYDGMNAVFVTAEKLKDAWVSTQPAKDGIDFEAKQLLVNIKHADLVVIDDLVAETDFFLERFKALLDDVRGKIVITTKLPLGQVKGVFGEDIYSRMMENVQECIIGGPDHRRMQ